MKRAGCYDVPQWHGMLYDEGEHAADVENMGDAKAAGFSDAFMPELFHRLYAETPAEVPPESRDKGAAVRAKLHDLAGELPEFETLRKRTVRDATWANMATDSLADAVASALPARHPGHDSPDADAARRLLDNLRTLSESLDVGDEIARAEGAAGGTAFAVGEQAGELDPSALRQALRRGIETAQESLDQASEACAAFGWGAASDTGAKFSPGVACELAKRVKNSNKLRRIVELAGRLQSTARAKRATKSDYARSELVGVEQTGNVARLLPSELGALADPLRTVDLVRRLGERSALGYAVRGREKTTKGPIVVGLDVSGSMGGEKEIWGAAVALACLDIARRDRRAFGVVLFNGRVLGSYYAPKPEAVDPIALLDVFTVGAQGGCNFDVPIVPSLDMIAKHGTLGKADVILITDALADTSHAAGEKARADKMGVHVFGICIGERADSLKPWAHEVTSIDDVSSDTEATDLIFEGL